MGPRQEKVRKKCTSGKACTRNEMSKSIKSKPIQERSCLYLGKMELKSKQSMHIVVKNHSDTIIHNTWFSILPEKKFWNLLHSHGMRCKGAKFLIFLRAYLIMRTILRTVRILGNDQVMSIVLVMPACASSPMYDYVKNADEEQIKTQPHGRIISISFLSYCTRQFGQRQKYNCYFIFLAYQH